MPLPQKLQEIVDDFAGMSREEKIETLIAYAESLPPLPERFAEERAKMEPIPECMTPVFLFGEKQADGGVVFYLDIPPQSPTVQGLACILTTGLNGCKPEEILAVPADFFTPMKLEEAISGQRLNGFRGVLAHMKQTTVNLMEA
ncbi:MAG: SufE family protein [Chloroflexi bacterium]|nr:SufE family protein [Chloroflexota bacterium]